MPASPCITYISNDDLRKIVSQIDAEKLNQIGQEFLDVTPTDLQNYLFSAKGDVELYKFKILESWRNKNDGPDARQNLYEILLEASEKQLIDPECLNPEWFLTDPTENRTEHGQDKSNDDNANEVKSHRKHSSDSSSAKLLLSVAVQALVIVLAIFTLPDFHHIEGPVLVVVGGSLYPEKGERLTSNAVNVYSLNNGQITWSHQGKYTPIGWTDAGGTTYNGRLYISGGRAWLRETGHYQYEAAHYNLTTDSWTFLPPMTKMTWNSIAVFVHRETMYAIHAVGFGYSQPRPLQSLDLRNPKHGWQDIPVRLPHDISGQNPNTIATVGDKVYVVGQAEPRESTTVVSWSPGTEEPWKEVAGMNVVRNQWWLCTVTDNFNKIWVIGGCRNCWDNGLIEEFSPTTSTWSRITTPGPNVTFDKTYGAIAHVCGYASGYIYTVFGYTDEEYKFHMDKRFHVFNLKDRRWSTSDTELQVEAYWPVTAVIPDKEG